MLCPLIYKSFFSLGLDNFNTKWVLLHKTRFPICSFSIHILYQLFSLFLLRDIHEIDAEYD